MAYVTLPQKAVGIFASLPAIIQSLHICYQPINQVRTCWKSIKSVIGVTESINAGQLSESLQEINHQNTWPLISTISAGWLIIFIFIHLYRAYSEALPTPARSNYTDLNCWRKVLGNVRIIAISAIIINDKSLQYPI